MNALPEVELVPSGPLSGALEAPTSKSVTNRLLVISSLAEGTSRLTGLLASDDTAAMVTALRRLGAGVDEALPGVSSIAGTGGVLEPPGQALSAGLSGTTLRFLLGMSLLVRGRLVLDGEPALRRRPIAPLLEALTRLGAHVESSGGTLPVRVTASGFDGGEASIDAALSSQFATALLLVGPYGSRDLELSVHNLGAGGYLALTVDAMQRHGAVVEAAGEDRFRVAAGARYASKDEKVEYDASAAAHLYALAMASGGRVTVTNARSSCQPDAAVVDVLAAMGARVERADGGVTVESSGALKGVEVDLSQMPDQLPTLAVLGALASGVTTLANVGVARGHETDRLAAVATELDRLGGCVEVEGDRVAVRGGRPLHGGVVDTYEDHRMAMAFAALGSVVPGIRIRSPGCVTKTYPRFWADAIKLGLQVRY